GQRYYVEALHKQAWGPGYLAVAWTLPNGTRQEPIPGSALIPFAAPTTSTPPPPTTGPTTGSTTGTVSGTRARITVTFAAPVASATASIAPTLYNKARVLQLEEDDAPLAAFTDLYPLLRGGTRNGQSLPGLRFTDGCGRSRPFTAAVAINGRNTYNNSVWLDAGPNHDPGKLVWSQAQTLLSSGWDIENHSDLHTATNPAQQIADLDALIANRLQGYKPSVHIVPTNFSGYPTAAFAAGYAAVSSNSQADNLPMLNPYNAGRVALSALPAAGTPFVYNRYLADLSAGETTQAQLARLKALTDALLAPGTTPTEAYLQRVFTHGMDFAVLADWMSYTQLAAQDRLWVTTLREFAEYRRVRSQVLKTEALSANTLTIDLDYANLSANTRFQNLTLLLDSPGTIASITVTGADSATYNLSTKMVNVFRHQQATTSTPTPTPTPTPTACTGTGSLTREQWDNVPGNTVAAVPTGTPPSSTAPVAQFEAPAQTATNYAARLRGFICPPQTGTYTFWIVADDAAELYLSPDADPARKVPLAACAGWTASARDFTRYPSQRSAPVTLQAGQRYYVEALHKQAWGPGYLAVAWTLPNGTRQEPIPGSALIPYSATASRGQLATSTATATSSEPRSSLAGAAQASRVEVYPNPLSGSQSRGLISFEVAQGGPVALSLFNLKGQLVRQLFAGTVEPGVRREQPLNTAGLSEGVYLVRLVTSREVINQKVVVGR
ncbi:PA14 domain-containing protein, partial [Hymenobacter saemangeumensis]|uniref:PA14 domain-containing protein n=1 Tax=Hymenobacter saemangeumensis TaxID=1084522 RepID=UPI0031E65599